MTQPTAGRPGPEPVDGDTGPGPDRGPRSVPGRRPPPQGFWRRNARRLMVGAGGFGLMLIGIVLAFPGIPGPGVAIIIAGLAVLATEFEWAERRLEWARSRFDRAARRAGVNPWVAAVGGLAVLVLAAVGGTLLWFYLFR